MTKLLKKWWARFLFQDRGIIPSARSLLLYGIFSIVLIGFGIWIEIPWYLIFSINILFLLGTFIDLFYLPKRKDVICERNFPKDMERGIVYPIEVSVINKSRHPFSYLMVDGLPKTFKRVFPVKGKCQAKSTVIHTYETMAAERGKYEVGKLYVRIRSFLGLWQRQITFDMTEEVKVIPDLTETKRYLEDTQKYLLYEGTVIRKQQSGMGEFAQIRQYVVGDDPRLINWRQTAKLQEVMTNDYEPEHGKYVTILIDCGRMMGAELPKGNRLEKVLEAAMTVAAAALEKGDYISVVAFSKEVKVFVPPGKGMKHLQTILHAVYDLQVDPVESNYAQVLSYVETHQKKRSLLLLFSDVRTFLYERNALIYLQRLRQRHLFLMIGIQDHVLQRIVQMKPTDIEKTMQKSMAQKQILFKRNEKAKWERRGMLMIEAREEKLAVTAVSLYMDVLNRQLI